MKNTLLFFAVLLAAITASAYTTNEDDDFTLIGSGTDESVVLTEAGTLREVVTDLESVRIRSIKVSGPINGADIAFLRSESGRFMELESIDLSDATLDPDETTIYATNMTLLGGTLNDGNVYCYILGSVNRKVFWKKDYVGLTYASYYLFYNDNLAAAFQGLKKLRRLVLPQDLPGIGENCFANCSELVQVDIPSQVTAIDDDAFYDCQKLNRTEIPSTVKRIGEKAFYRSGVARASLGNVEKMGRYAFYECKNLEGNMDLTSLDTIPYGAFWDCKKLNDVTLSPSLKAIGGNAFGEIAKSSPLHIPDGCRYVGEYAFGGTKISEVTVPDSLLDINYSAFNDTPWLKNEKANTTGPVVYLGKIALQIDNNYTGTELTIKDGTLAVASLDHFDGKWRETLRDVTLPSSLRIIGENVFFRCGQLQSIALPDALEHIGYRAFYQTNIRDVTFGSHLKTIGEAAFAGCNNLAQISLPANIEEIGKEAFGGCKGLVKAVYDVPAATGEHIFLNCNSLEKITFGPNVRTIPENICSDLSSLYKVEFSEGLEEIGKVAFCALPIRSIVLPETVKTIQEYAFSNCLELREVTCSSVTPPAIEECTFGDVNMAECVLKVPNAALYRSAPYWSEFQHIVSTSVVDVAAIELDKIQLTLTIGATESLTATVLPEDATDKTLVWTSSDESVATVSTEGLVTAEGAGEAIITAQCGEVTATCMVKVLKNCQLTYLIDDEVYHSETMTEGSGITPLAVPEKEGYTFSGWSEIPETMPANDVTVTGTFTVNTYVVRYYDGKTLLAEYKVEFGAAIPQYEYDNEKFIFQGWEGEQFKTMPAHDIAYYAKTMPNSIEDIADSHNSMSGTSDIYNLSGQPVGEGTKGIRIQNGKKFIRR